MVFLHLLLVCVVGLAAVGTARGQESVYQITFKDHTTVAQVNAVIETLENDYAITIIKAYHFDIFSVLSVSGTAENIDSAAGLPNIEYIEKDGNTGAAEAGECTEIDSPGTWGLDRIDQKNKLISSDELDKRAQYLLGPYTGAGVTAYIVDTGIDITHPAFGGRAFHGYTSSGLAHAGNNDDSGHGTAVAGIVGSTNYGIAKNVTLVAVKVLGTGRFDPIIEGLQWVYDDLVARDDASVVTLAWIVPKHEGINKIVLSLARKKAVIVAAAGNVAQEACLYSPASAPATTTVASMNINDIASNFSNWGGCVHIFAPGMNILSTWRGGRTIIIWGTSMAAAHVAGVAALKLSKEDMSSGQMRAWLVRRSWKNILTYPNDDQKKTPNRLLFVDCELNNN